ncbi:MAG: AmmeMemoRadiSam system protein B [Dehalococcoidales bacterium]|nr:AmmeMemoRadiSam system protein B [Dehalococcoidales bacterium]
MNRNPYVAGYFYPASASELRKMLAGFMSNDAPKEEAPGALVPHAGYIYSGAVTGAVISRIKPGDTFVVIGPSHSGLGKPFSVWAEGIWETPLGEVEVDRELAGKMVAVSEYLEEDYLAHREEHAVEVQLPFLQYARADIRIVPVILSGATLEIYKEIGKDIARAVRELGRKAVILASGDMTHYEPDHVARQKDMKAVEAMLALDEDGLTRHYHKLNISMCAYGPVVCTIAAVKELGATGGELIRYQTSGDTTGDRSAVVGYAGVIFKKEELHPIVALAKRAVETYVRERRVIPAPAELTPEMKERAGVFVSIHKHGELRGCIGTFEPQQENVAQEIIINAISSATRDPRFPPVEPEELKDLDYSVDILTSPEPVADKSELDPRRYGVIVERGFRRGLLLPDLEGVDSVDYQIEICRQKAGIAPHEPVKLYRFEVRRYRQKG